MGRDVCTLPLQDRQPGCSHHNLFAAPHSIRALQPNKVSVTTCSTQRQTRAGTEQEQVPKCCMCALMEHLGKRRLQGGGVVACRALSLRNRASLLLGVLFGHTHTCCIAPTVSRVAIASLCIDDFEYLFQNCSREGLGPARQEGICQKDHTHTEFSLRIN